jgi:hypothetical protein
MHEVLSFAREYVLEHKRPFLIEAKTTALGSHHFRRSHPLPQQGRRGSAGPLKTLPNDSGLVVKHNIWEPALEEELTAQFAADRRRI